MPDRTSLTIGGQTAMVTGGGNGIGRAICFTLAENGATVYVCDLDGAAAESTAAEIAQSGHRAKPLYCDVSDPASVEAAVETASADGGIEILVHCAAIFARHKILDMPLEDWHRVLNVNLTGTFLVGKAAGAHMQARGSGTILMMASDRGLYGGVGNSNYAASKGGMIAFMKSLALELAPSGVTVNAVNPGTTMTPRLEAEASEEFIRRRREADPQGKLSTPENVAGLVLYLVSPAARFITGQLVTTRIRQA
ncbi:SDR family NAD(P)-dependent oxidoreductase [Saccharomonospora sp. NPDC046836]|uniref:SDR family NAD(P)-dependent oxidoreductase n=1 Tax=Saccharomonospora sp. NPDC046836 TaxID=3156921 RepID=UPI0033C58DCF